MKETDNQLENFKKVLRNKIEKNLEEIDLIATDKSSWEEMKANFKDIITNLLANIENDEYSDGKSEIDQAITILNKWKQKISKGLVGESK